MSQARMLLQQVLRAHSLTSTATSVGWGLAGPQSQLCRCLCTSGARWMNAKPQEAAEASTSQQEQASSSSGQEQQQQQQGSGAEDVKQKVFSSFKSGFSRARHVDAKGVIQDFTKEIRDVFKTADNIRSATRMYTGPVMDMSTYDGSTALQLVQQQQTSWEKLQERLMSVPLFAKLSGFKIQDTAAYKKSQETIEDLKEKYETSDHPMVHKVDEYKAKLLAGSESSRAMREIRARDPSFDLNTFVRAIKLDAPVVVRALLHKDLESLSLHMGSEMMERLGGIFKHEAARGLFEDPTILFVSDVEIVEVRLVDEDPFVVAQFHCQQIKCARDQFGNVVEGSPDAIQRVYYFWGLQQEKTGVITADGELLPPRWVIRDMMWQSMLALV